MANSWHLNTRVTAFANQRVMLRWDRLVEHRWHALFMMIRMNQFTDYILWSLLTLISAAIINKYFKYFEKFLHKLNNWKGTWFSLSYFLVCRESRVSQPSIYDRSLNHIRKFIVNLWLLMSVDIFLRLNVRKQWLPWNHCMFVIFGPPFDQDALFQTALSKSTKHFMIIRRCAIMAAGCNEN